MNEVDPEGRFVRIETSPRMPDRLFVGSRVPKIEATTLAGKKVRLDSLCKAGKFTVLDFWGHWCQPCVMAIPETLEFQAEWKERVELIGIHSGDHDQAKKLLDENGVEWLQLESNDLLEKDFFVDGWPTYVLIGEDGTIQSFRTTLPDITRKLRGE